MIVEAAVAVVVDRSIATIAATPLFRRPRRSRRSIGVGGARRIACLSEKRPGSFHSGEPKKRHAGSRRSTTVGTNASADGVATNPIKSE